MNYAKFLFLTVVLLLIVKSTLFADVPMPCYIIESHVHTMDKNKNLITCACTLQNASSYTNHNLWQIENARKHHKKFDPGPPSITRQQGRTQFSDTICYYHQRSWSFGKTSCYDKEVTPKIIIQDTLLPQRQGERKLFIPVVSLLADGTALMSLYTSGTYLIPLFLTLLIEIFIAIGFMLFFRISLRCLWIVPLCSLITHPALAYLQWTCFLSFNQIVGVECGIVLVEMLIIMAALRHQIKPRYAFALSALMNGASFLIGSVVLQNFL